MEVKHQTEFSLHTPDYNVFPGSQLCVIFVPRLG